ncbi:MAG: DNA-binding response OmpR family regulator [Parasphingorhabdus sp.]|jgi:DNA-binding response OmpR family regulator|uniref:response regulator transcription factor n=1 Tax=Parasphingorhabdus sp. TaxID=2709688 RepID=UPI001B49521A|nr:response regulator transcription factor [Parasphingorhabdus sp.]MBQ0770197.1 response regulator transcription factor [Sphingomonadales bacterium]|tara:strand:- start:7160 stop:7855 length:696 start_codon:yes stop_codon:yes gene_type:complete
MRVAIADDDSDIIDFLGKIVEGQGYVYTGYADGTSLSNALLRDTFDLVILDWNMPGKNGMQILEWMESAVEDRPPVIMMTSRTAKQDISDALNAGADDYITKPEDKNVIAARINALLRRNSGASAMETVVEYGDYLLNRIEQTVRHDNKEIALTAKEFELTDLMFRNRDRTLSRRYIMETVWRTNAHLATRTLDMHVSRIRSKLALKPENGFRIFTVFGYGYRLETLGNGG